MSPAVTSPHAAVLLIDADRKFCDAATNLLTGSGYRVEVVHHAVDALDKARTHRWQAMVLNVVLPDFNGLNFL